MEYAINSEKEKPLITRPAHRPIITTISASAVAHMIRGWNNLQLSTNTLKSSVFWSELLTEFQSKPECADTNSLNKKNLTVNTTGFHCLMPVINERSAVVLNSFFLCFTPSTYSL
jgi:hypothetical protein